MKKWSVLPLLAVLAALALLPGSAGAAANNPTTNYPTHMQWAIQTCSLGSCTIAGRLVATRKCQWLRKVKLYERTSSGLVHLDSGISSGQGGWAFHYAQPDPSNPDPRIPVRFAVTEAVRFNGNVVCQGETVDDTL